MSNWESNLEKELRFHLEEAFEEHMKSGLSETEARRRAQLEFGAPDIAKEECRDTRSVRWLRDLSQDIRYALRTYWKSPGIALVVIFTLALGIGATTAVFSLVHSVLLRSLPYPEASSLVYVWSPNPHFAAAPKEIGPPNATYYDWQRLSNSFENLALFMETGMRFSSGAESPERIPALLVSGNLFRTLGVRPELGRVITEEDDQPGRENVVVLSHRLWQSKFNGASDVLEKTVRLAARTYRIVGVMPREFGFPWRWEMPAAVRDGTATDVWIPLAFTTKQRADQGYAGFGDGTVIGRLKQGVSVAQGQAEMTPIMQKLAAQRTGLGREVQVLVRSFVETVFGDIRAEMLLLMGAVALVLLITCGNVAGLLLARYSGRVQEMGVRSALGASRSRLIRLMIAESLLLSAAGGALGVGVAWAGIRAFVSLAPADLPRVAQTSVDFTALFFALAASIVTDLLCGLLPALSASRRNFLSQVQTGGARGVTRSFRTRSILISCEVALSLILVAGAGLLIRSYIRMTSERAGFSGEVLTTVVRAPENTTPEQRLKLFHQILDEINTRPEVIAAATNSNIPMSGGGQVESLQVEGVSKQETSAVNSRQISPQYFEAMGIPLLEGRLFENRDSTSKTRSIIASDGFARQYFPGQSAIGKHIRDSEDQPWNEIIGVVGNVRNNGLDVPPLNEIYEMDRDPGWRTFFVIRSRVPAAELAPMFRKIVLSKEPEATIEQFRTMNDRIWEMGIPRRFNTSVLSSFAMMALVLAVVGLFGLVAHSVRMRTSELGLRMALGATQSAVFKMVLGQAFRLLASGAMIGLAGSWFLTRLLSAMLYGVGATDPVTFLTAPVLLIMAGLAAVALPALRASRVDPATALRHD